MKRFTFISLALTSLSLVAFAAETIRFEPIVGTITKYRTTIQTTTEIQNSSITTSDGQPVPKAFENLLELLKASLNSTQTQDITEKIVSLDANGARQLETTILQSSQATAIGFEMRSSVTPDGQLTISSFKFDAATATQPGISVLGDSFLTAIRNVYAQQYPNIYGQALNPLQSLKFSSSTQDSVRAIFTSLPNAKIQIEGLQNNLEYIYQGRNASNDHVFKVAGNTTAGSFVAELSGIRLEQRTGGSLLEGEIVYLADGRLKSSRQSGGQLLTQIQSINLGQQTLTISFTAKTNSVSSTQILP